jgi:hypothetical protein
MPPCITTAVNFVASTRSWDMTRITMSLVVWTNLTRSPDGKTTANAMMPALLDEIYAGVSLAPSATPTTTR